MENQKTDKLTYQVVCIAVYLLIASVFCWLFFYRTSTVQIKIGKTLYTTEISRTPEARAEGLSDRDSLCNTCAMLFVFDTPGKYGFWMKDMRFAIDILWLKDGKIIYKKSKASPEERETFVPPEEADSVIEILPNSEVQVGDTVLYE